MTRAGDRVRLGIVGQGIHSVMMANAVILGALKKKPVDLPMDGREFAALLTERGVGAAAP
jgi:hypothetical protein